MTASGYNLYKKSARDAQYELIERYAPLVKRIAYHLLARLPASVQVEDLMQAGMIGLLEAAKKYDSRFRERQFTPNPASWLNAKGYMNDYTGGEQRGNDDGYAGFTPSGGFGSFG